MLSVHSMRINARSDKRLASSQWMSYAACHVLRFRAKVNLRAKDVPVWNKSATVTCSAIWRQAIDPSGATAISDSLVGSKMCQLTDVPNDGMT